MISIIYPNPLVVLCNSIYFFFQAEDGIRDYKVTGVQTCALPILRARDRAELRLRSHARNVSTALATARRCEPVPAFHRASIVKPAQPLRVVRSTTTRNCAGLHSLDVTACCCLFQTPPATAPLQSVHPKL